MYHRRRDNHTLTLGIMTFILFLVVVTLNLYPKLKDFNATAYFKDVEVKIVSFVSKPFLSMKKTSKKKSTKSLEKDYEKLKKKVDAIESQEKKIESLEKEVEELKKQLELNTTLGEKMKINATVINRTVDYWNQKLTIDKGKKEHVQNGMAVITPKGLIGITTSTSNHASSVKLLTSETFTKISVRIKVDDHYVYGLLSGYKDKKFIVEGISENGEIKEDAVVTTTGMGKTFPAGLFVGKVSKVTTDNFDLAKIVEVTPSADFEDLTYVTVVKRDENYDNH